MHIPKWVHVKVWRFCPSFSADPNFQLFWLGKWQHKRVSLDWAYLCTEYGGTGAKGQHKGSIISEGNWRDGILSTYQCRNSLLLTYFLETVIINCYLWKCKSKCNQLAAMVVAYYKSSKPQLTLWLICLIMNADVGTPSCSCYLPHLQSYLTFWLRFRLYFSNKWNTERERQESVCDIRAGMPFMIFF